MNIHSDLYPATVSHGLVRSRGVLERLLSRSALLTALLFPLLGAPVVVASDMFAPLGGSGFTAVLVEDGVPSFVSVDAISARRLRARGVEVAETVVFAVPSTPQVVSTQNVPPIPSVVFAAPSGPLVAVVDTGLDVSHSWFSGEFAGHVVPGRSVVGDPTNWLDTNGHGTHVAGVVRLVDPSARILPVRVFDASGFGTDRAVADGIVWAVENGARVVNVSLGGPARSLATERAVDFARSRDVVVVAAAGNYGDQGSPVMYPAAFESVVAVAAHDAFSPAFFSNRGAYVDVSAEGMSVWSAHLSNRVVLMGGTSMASPFVAAVAARVRAARPDLDAETVKSLLESSAVDIGEPGRDDVFGWGAVDADRALAAAVGVPQLPAPVSAGALSVSLVPRLGSVLMRAESPVSAVEVFADGMPVFSQAGSPGPWVFEMAHEAEVTVRAVDVEGRIYEPFVAKVSPKPVPSPKVSVVRRGAKSKVDVRLVLPRLEGRTVLVAVSGEEEVEFDVPRSGKSTSVVYRLSLDRSRPWAVRACLFYGSAGMVCSVSVPVR